MLITPSHVRLPRPARRNGGRRGRIRRAPRRGVVALLAIWMLVIFVLTAAWVLNYNFLVLLGRNLQQKCDAIALAAAPALLDEDLLRDYPAPPVPNQIDDCAEAERVASRYRELNNQAQSPAFRVPSSALTIESGFVADLTGETPYRFDRSIPLGDPISPRNTLHVSSQRTIGGDHPVRYLLNLLGGDAAPAADLRSGAFATLDNLVIGFRPEASASSPVMPLAISTDAWRIERAAGDDANGNGIRELLLRLESPDQQPADANSVLVFFDGNVDLDALSAQMLLGLFPDDLPPDGRLGPATPSSPCSVAAVREVDPLQDGERNRELAGALSRLADDGAVRVFPLFDSRGDSPEGQNGRRAWEQVRLIGFVAATVLDAAVVDRRLTATIEPAFLIHCTAWTAGPGDPARPEPNLYLHKLRLSH
ncbi:MAG: hypothetical protein JXB62_10320 [Pirellulales bacterium]|nr:hypothetical protein [Pirellulales bacterium]